MPDVPDVGNLQRDAILVSMLQHISDYERKDPLVNVEALKNSVIKKVINAPYPDRPGHFSQETQLRGFLQAFESTFEYSSQFKILDERTQAQIKTFKDKSETWKDERIWQDTHEKGFFLPEANPDVSQVLATAVNTPASRNGIKRFFSRAFVSIARPLVLLSLKFQSWEAAKKLESTQARNFGRGPRIYEYEDHKHAEPMTVCLDIRLIPGLPYTDCARLILNCPLKIGANLFRILLNILLFPRPSLVFRTSCASRIKKITESVVAVTGTVGQRPSLKISKSSFPCCRCFRSRCCRIR